MKRSSRDLALCGVLCALAVAIMAMGTILPAATYCCPVLASMTLVPVLILCGERLSWAMFAASAILSLLLAPDKEAAAIFLALGYYPIVKPKLDRKPKPRAHCLQAASFQRGDFRGIRRASFYLPAGRAARGALLDGLVADTRAHLGRERHFLAGRQASRAPGGSAHCGALRPMDTKAPIIRKRRTGDCLPLL